LEQVHKADANFSQINLYICWNKALLQLYYPDLLVKLLKNQTNMILT